MFESRISAGATEKWPCSENIRIPSWSYDMEGHAKKCVERYCELVNKNDSTTLQSINSMHWWPSLQRRRIEIRGRIGESVLSNCSEMLILGTDWKTWYSMVSEQTCTIDYKMVQSLWQTISTLYITFIIRVNTSSIVKCKTLQNNADWDCFGTPILQEIERIQNLLQGEHCAFSEVIHLFQSVGCVRNKLHFRTVQQNLKSSLWTLDWD